MNNKEIYILWNCKKGTLESVEHKEQDSREWLNRVYELLDCDTIDITSRMIGGFRYDIVCDDEGLLKSDHIISLWRNGEPQLVGNLLFVSHDEEGRTLPLSKSMEKNLLKTLKIAYYTTPEMEVKESLAYEQAE